MCTNVFTNNLMGEGMSVFEMGLTISTKFKAACLLQRPDSLAPEIVKSLHKAELWGKKTGSRGHMGLAVWEDCPFLVPQPVGK